ncbi:hypothetical protein BYT27DRAFT_7258607 [Phlegmacium glaucopus]|nr:hypothetical protein BYT27DRAFT_7258607 [Phlegmacium glaucopus]
MKNIFIFFASLFTSGLALYHSAIEADNSTQQNPFKNLATACGDPSASVTYFEAFSVPNKLHSLNTLPAYVDASALGSVWQFVEASCNAWTSSGQASTVPLYILFNPTTIDVMYLISTNGTPPTFPGFDNKGIIAYVYPTQICGSVPLYAASLAIGDHWYTTNLADRDALVSLGSGWTNAGIAAYVLPANGMFILLIQSEASPFKS